MIRTGSVVSVDAEAGTIRLAVSRAEVAFGAHSGEETMDGVQETEELEVALADLLAKDDWRLL